MTYLTIGKWLYFRSTQGAESLTAMWGFFCVYLPLVILFSAKTNQIDEFWRVIRINY